MVAIPGLYNDFVWPNIWGSSYSFAIPGPPVLSFDGSSDAPATWSQPPANPTATVGVVGQGQGAMTGTPVDDWDYSTTAVGNTVKATATKKSSTTPTTLPVSTGKVQCTVRKIARTGGSHDLNKRGFNKHKSRLSLGKFGPAYPHPAPSNHCYYRPTLLMVK
jgi:hypothetical protein